MQRRPKPALFFSVAQFRKSLQSFFAHLSFVARIHLVLAACPAVSRWASPPVTSSPDVEGRVCDPPAVVCRNSGGFETRPHGAVVHGRDAHATKCRGDRPVVHPHRRAERVTWPLAAMNGGPSLVGARHASP